jgi:hypothetical protein
MYIRDKYAKQLTIIATDARNDKIWVKLDKAVGLGEDLYLCLLFLPPEKTAASKPSQAKIRKTYKTFSEEIIMDQEKGYVLLAGDLNARTGLLQEASSNRSGIPDHIQPGTEILPPRASEDAKGGHNFSGRALMELCDTTDLAIVNGRTLGDANDSYTHHSATTEKDNLGVIAW